MTNYKAVLYFEDHEGLLDKRTLPDGGDTGQREGMYWTLRAICFGMVALVVENFAFRLSTFAEVIEKLHPSPGVLLRHSEVAWSASDWDRMTPDQMRPMIPAMALWAPEELSKFVRGHAKRLFLFANNTRHNGATKANHGQVEGEHLRDYSWKVPDLTGPTVWASLIRGTKAWYFCPLLFVFDIFHLASAIKWRYFPKHNIILNHATDAVWFRYRWPTIASTIALAIMPPKRIVPIVKDHFDDFGDDMQFFETMFNMAFYKARKGRLYMHLAGEVIFWAIVVGGTYYILTEC